MYRHPAAAACAHRSSVERNECLLSCAFCACDKPHLWCWKLTHIHSLRLLEHGAVFVWSLSGDLSAAGFGDLVHVAGGHVVERLSQRYSGELPGTAPITARV